MFPPLPAATRALIILNVVVYLLQALSGHRFDEALVLWPLGSGQFHAWQLLTYGFLHANWTHIFFNMFALFMFGGQLETLWGPRRMLAFWLVCILTAGLTQLAVGGQSPALGASGGVFGVLLAFAWYFPRQRLILLPIPVPMPAWLFVTAYALLELYFGITGGQQDVAHFAHLGGLLGGALCILYWRARHRFGR
jgi:membrane associated rhomboid family serine protease